jgi:hypothetical protein
MPRYFFHVQNGQYYPDDEGTVLASPEVARLESMAAASEMLVDAGVKLWTGEPWTMQVIDEAGRPVCRLTVFAKIEVSAN